MNYRLQPPTFSERVARAIALVLRRLPANIFADVLGQAVADVGRRELDQWERGECDLLYTRRPDGSILPVWIFGDGMSDSRASGRQVRVSEEGTTRTVEQLAPVSDDLADAEAAVARGWVDAARDSHGDVRCRECGGVVEDGRGSVSLMGRGVTCPDCSKKYIPERCREGACNVADPATHCFHTAFGVRCCRCGFRPEGSAGNGFSERPEKETATE